MNHRQRNTEILTFAFGVALLPPLWAVAAPYVGVTTGAVALICAGLYAAQGNRKQDALRVSAGFLMGDIWAVLTICLMAVLKWNPNLELYVIFFVLGGAAVIGGEMLPRYFYTPSWLGGWAIGLTIMGTTPLEGLHTLPLQIGLSMLIGVYGVGLGVGAFQKWILGLLEARA